MAAASSPVLPPEIPHDVKRQANPIVAIATLLDRLIFIIDFLSQCLVTAGELLPNLLSVASCRIQRMHWCEQVAY